MILIEALINFIVSTSFEIGSWIDEFLSFGKKPVDQNPESAVKRIILSLIGGLIICSLVLGVIVLIIWAVFRFMF